MPISGFRSLNKLGPLVAKIKTGFTVPAGCLQGHLSQISSHFVNFETNLLPKNPNGGYPSAKLHRKREGPRFARALKIIPVEIEQSGSKYAIIKARAKQGPSLFLCSLAEG